jgi:GT2 family glycosyltransferase
MILNRTVRIVCATRSRTADDFAHETELGRSLASFTNELKPLVCVKFDNAGAEQIGLSRLYNLFLQPQYAGEIALFVHDDVHLTDWCLAYRLIEAMEHFDIVGIVGNAEPDYYEPAWYLAWNKEKHPLGHQPREHTSGALAHHLNDGTVVRSWYGTAPRECKLLDGFFLAVDVDRALAANVRFDEQFDFHFYDLDFCRAATSAGLRLGTWPIAVTHASAGSFFTEPWLNAMERYGRKWNSNLDVNETANSPSPEPKPAGILRSLLRGRSRA